MAPPGRRPRPAFSGRGGRKARIALSAISYPGRRTFATRLAEAGANLRDIQKLMDHASIALTAEYVEASPERLKRVAALLGGRR